MLFSTAFTMTEETARVWVLFPAAGNLELDPSTLAAGCGSMPVAAWIAFDRRTRGIRSGEEE